MLRNKNISIRKIIYFFVFIIVVLCITDIFILVRRIDNMRFVFEENREKYSLMQKQVNLYKNNYSFQLLSKGLKLSDTLKVKSINNKEFFLKDIVKEPTLIFRLNILDCNQCNQHFLFLLDSVFSNNNPKPIILLVNSENQMGKSEYNDFSFDVFFLNHIPLPHEQLNISYFFILDKNLVCIESVFFETDMNNLLFTFLKYFIYMRNRLY